MPAFGVSAKFRAEGFGGVVGPVMEFEDTIPSRHGGRLRRAGADLI